MEWAGRAGLARRLFLKKNFESKFGTIGFLVLT
jgi:hypothetical protein